MALLPYDVPDLNYRIMFLLQPRYILRLAQVDKRSNELIKRSNVYQDLITLREIKPKYPFESTHIIVQYYRHGLIHLLTQYHYDHPRSIDAAAAHNHINILEWRRRSMLKFKYSSAAIYSAAAGGHVEVLEWFRIYCTQTGKKFKYCSQARDVAAISGHINVLDWFFRFGYLFIYPNKWAINLAAAFGQIWVLDWFRTHTMKPGFECGLIFDYGKRAINQAATNGYVNVLDWFYQSGLPFKHDCDAIDGAAENGHIKVLKWFRSKTDLVFIHSDNIITRAAANGQIDILEWFYQSGLEFRYDSDTIDIAARMGHVAVLEWFRQKSPDLEFIYTDAVVLAAEYGHTPVLTWFKKSGLENSLVVDAIYWKRQCIKWGRKINCYFQSWL